MNIRHSTNTRTSPPDQFLACCSCQPVGLSLLLYSSRHHLLLLPAMAYYFHLVSEWPITIRKNGGMSPRTFTAWWGYWRRADWRPGRGQQRVALDWDLGLAIGQIRRALSLDFVWARSLCLLSRLCYLGDGARAAVTGRQRVGEQISKPTTRPISRAG